MDYSQVLRLPQYFRNLQRLSEILAVLAKHGFGDLLDRLKLRPYLESGLQALRLQFSAERQPSMELGTRLRLVCEELGPTFIKFAQLVASRPDVFPFAVVRELRKLEDRVAPFAPEQARQVVEQDLGLPLDQLFSSFEDQPLAAASIAQVHRAVLRDSRAVVVKIQRPGIERIIDTDIDILCGLATLIQENIPEARIYNPLELVNEFARGLRRECDFGREAYSIRQFASNFSKEAALHIPEVYTQYTTRRVLTEELVEGVKIDDLSGIRAFGYAPRELAAVLSRVVLKSIFEHRFFHADPHPGNIFVSRQGKICLVDFGAMGRLDRGRIRFILQFLAGVLSADLEKTVRVLKESDMAPPVLDEVSLKTQIAEIIDAHLSRPLGKLDISRLLADIFEAVQRYDIRPPPDLLLVGKSLTLLQYIGALLDPDFDPLGSIKPYILQRYAAALTDRKFYLSYAADVSDSYRRLVGELPAYIRIAARKLSQDALILNHASKDLEVVLRHQNTLLNRAIMTLIGLAFFALGVLIIALQTPPIHLGLAYLLIVVGALLLISVWLAVRRSGGTS